MMNIEEIMATEVYTLSDTDSAYAARRIMLENNIRHIPVVDEEDKILGMVSDRDVLAASESSLNEASSTDRAVCLSQIKLFDIMTTAVNVIDYRESLLSAALHLQRNRHSSMPVVKNGKLVGIVTDSDFVNLAIQSIEIMEDNDAIAEDLTEFDAVV